MTDPVTDDQHSAQPDRSRGSRLVDLSHPIDAGMVTYPGLPAPEIRHHLAREASRGRYAPGVEFQIDMITLCGNTGTYIDSPFHRFEDGIDLAALPLERLVDVPTVRVDVTGITGLAVDADALRDHDLAGRAVLVHTGFDRHWGAAAYLADNPFLTRAAAELLVAAGAALVGIDSLNIDSTDDPERPAHSILLGAGIPVVEHMTNLGLVPVTGARFTALPAPIRGTGTFPVRAIARVPAAT
jgi:arylformamidase